MAFEVKNDEAKDRNADYLHYSVLFFRLKINFKLKLSLFFY